MKLAVRLTALLLIVTSGLAIAADEDGDPAPRFRARTLSGETFNNESVKGKVVLFEFWTTWCQYCHQEEALIEQIDKEFSSKGVIVLAVDVAESKKTVEKYLEQHPRACHIVLTEDTNLAAMYQANSYPIYVVIDRDGKIAAEQRGAGGERALRRMLARAGIRSEAPPDDN
jgi:thiol-disulfide isomerase/thioredoxin